MGGKGRSVMREWVRAFSRSTSHFSVSVAAGWGDVKSVLVNRGEGISLHRPGKVQERRGGQPISWRPTRTGAGIIYLLAFSWPDRTYTTRSLNVPVVGSLRIIFTFPSGIVSSLITT